MFFDDKKFNLPEVEAKVLEFWKKNKIFEKSLFQRSKAKPFVFYEGPPTANGMPHIGHAETRSFKDIIPRYKTMRGFFVGRKAGWDTHGLPVEIEIEKQMGFKNKADIEKFGIAAFNKLAKESVWKYKKEWEDFSDRFGYWLDYNDPYITYENNYIETLWWIFKETDKKKLLYQGHKVVPWCPRCGTALSSHEMAQGYKEITDNSVIVKFQITKSKLQTKFKSQSASWRTNSKHYLLAWTTTPWTLPGNVALAVNKKITYVILKDKESNDYYIVAKKRIDFVGKNFELQKEIKGEELIGTSYKPLFNVKKLQSSLSHKVYAADFVSDEDGTGIVHTAVMYGEDDYELGKKVGLPAHHTVAENGKFNREVTGLVGLFVRSKQTEEKIFKHLEENGNLLKTEPYTHEYPHCWRCDTPLIYYAHDSWFIKMSALRKELISENQKINWIPEHIKNGRFGEWLKEVKDWAISRERYWGTPLPIWQCGKCENKIVIGSIAELKERTIRKNNFFLVRHGESDHNVKDIFASVPEKKNTESKLTELGLKQASAAASELKKEKIDFIFSSPFLRAKKTAVMIASATKAKIITDARLGEIKGGIFEGKPIKSYWDYFARLGRNRFESAPEGGETILDVRKRMVGFLKDIQKKYKGKSIVVVSHGDPLRVLEATLDAVKDEQFESYPMHKLGSVKKIEAAELPFNDDNAIDLHRPYIDEVVLKCEKCHGKMTRIKEVADVWFDSGAMPYAQWHYPFENKEMIDKGKMFPADYISEAIDQTRGWFYSLLAVSTILGKGAPYKNVITFSFVLDKFGKKMSKSKGNAVSPNEMMNKYGADVLRWYFYTVNEPGDPKLFDEKDLSTAFNKFHSLYYNSSVFLRTYLAGKRVDIAKFSPAKLKNKLDQWIVALWNKALSTATVNLDKYDVVGAGRALEEFVSDLSHWFVRRSRSRFSNPDSKTDFDDASKTLVFILNEFSKAAAPFIPFLSEAVYTSLSEKTKRAESVHLENWPEADKKLIDEKLLESMKEIRRIASEALALRAKAGIKVRQPIASLKISAKGGSASGGKNQSASWRTKIKNDGDLLKILKDEINVKEIVFDSKIVNEFELDTKITPELYEEGMLRELARTVQKLRQDAGLKVGEIIEISLAVPEEIKNILEEKLNDFKTQIKAKKVEFLSPGEKPARRFDAELETKIDEKQIKIWIKKL